MKLPDFQEFDAFNSLRTAMHADLVEDLSPIKMRPLVLLPDPPPPPPKAEPMPEPQLIGIDKRMIAQLADEERAYIAAHASPIAKDLPDMALLDAVARTSVDLRISVALPEVVVAEAIPAIEEMQEVVEEPPVKEVVAPKVYRKPNPKVFRAPRKRLRTNFAFSLSLPQISKTFVSAVSVLLGAAVVVAGLYYAINWYHNLPEPVQIAQPKVQSPAQQNTVAEIKETMETAPPEPILEPVAPEPSPIQEVLPEPVYEQPAPEAQAVQQPIIPDMAPPPAITQPQQAQQPQQVQQPHRPSRNAPALPAAGTSRSPISAAAPTYDGGELGMSNGVLAAPSSSVADENAPQLQGIMNARPRHARVNDTLDGLPDFDAIVKNGGNVQQALDDYARASEMRKREAPKSYRRSQRKYRRFIRRR